MCAYVCMCALRGGQLPGLASPMSPDLADALEAFVTLGGTLILTADDAGALPASLTGVQLGQPAPFGASGAVDLTSSWAVGACVVCVCVVVEGWARLVRVCRLAGFAQL